MWIDHTKIYWSSLSSPFKSDWALRKHFHSTTCGNFETVLTNPWLCPEEKNTDKVWSKYDKFHNVLHLLRIASCICSHFCIKKRAIAASRWFVFWTKGFEFAKPWSSLMEAMQSMQCWSTCWEISNIIFKSIAKEPEQWAWPLLFQCWPVCLLYHGLFMIASWVLAFENITITNTADTVKCNVRFCPFCSVAQSIESYNHVYNHTQLRADENRR